MKYVLCFSFTPEQELLVVRKANPAWQKGKFNAPGGKIEDGEPPIVACLREYQEETGVATMASDWVEFAVLTGNDVKDTGWAVHCYRKLTPTLLGECNEGGEEPVSAVFIEALAQLPNVVPNLRYLAWAAYYNDAFIVVKYNDRVSKL